MEEAFVKSIFIFFNRTKDSNISFFFFFSNRLAKPFSTSSSITPIIPSTIPHEGITGSHLYENAGMGRIVRFENGMGLEVGEIVKRVKSHLGIQYGTSLERGFGDFSWQTRDGDLCNEGGFWRL